MPYRPMTRRYRLSGANHEAYLGPSEHMAFEILLWRDRIPTRMYKLAEVCHLPVPTATKAMAHLEKHGWAIPAHPGWTLEAGRDCDCPPRMRRKPTDGVQLEPIGEQCALYRFYGPFDILLYIGITEDLPGRMRQHEAAQPWWSDVERKTVAWYETRAKADRAETLAIAVEKPLHNKAKLYAPRMGVEFDC